MKYVYIKIIWLLVFITPRLMAVDQPMPAFKPHSPTIQALGGAYTAIATGYEALFTNPAGFADSQSTVTLLSVNPWIHIKPGEVSKLLEEEYRSQYWEKNSENGSGGGLSLGLGYVGKGLGLGIIGSAGGLFQGSPYPEGVEGKVLSDVCLIGGFAFTPLRGEEMKLHIGADLRPGIRFYSPLNALTITELAQSSGDEDGYINALNGSTLFQGAALAFDAGAIFRFGDLLNVGFSARDIMGTQYAMSGYSAGDWFRRVGKEGLPDNGLKTLDTYYVPMTLATGIAFWPPLGNLSSWLSLCLQAEYVYIFDMEQAYDTLWSPLSLGIEARFFKSLSLRFGMDKGEPSAGIGLNLFFMDMNIAGSSKGFSLEWAIRF